MLYISGMKMSPLQKILNLRLYFAQRTIYLKIQLNLAALVLKILQTTKTTLLN